MCGSMIPLMRQQLREKSLLFLFLFVVSALFTSCGGQQPIGPEEVSCRSPYYGGRCTGPIFSRDYHRHRHKKMRQDQQDLREERRALEKERRKLMREKEKFKKQQQNTKRPAKSAVRDKCPVGFSRGGRCTAKERKAGCKDVRTAAGTPCVKR